MSKPETMLHFLQHKVFKEAERKILAEKGQARPDGSFPIRNGADLRNAIQAYGRAKDKEAAKAWIIKRAKALDLVELLPDGWVSEGEASHMTTVETFLEHYGTKGMKWGVRKKRSASDDAKAAARHRGKKPSELSNDELRKLNERLNLEQNYSRMNPSRVQRGQRAATQILAVGGTVNAAIAFSRSPAGQALRGRIGR
jgi:hypothetical protein